VDFDQTVDEYGDMTSVPQGMIRSDDDVAEIRAQRAKQQQAAQAAESMKSMAGSAKGFIADGLRAEQRSEGGS